jgi:hypothetical protein
MCTQDQRSGPPKCFLAQDPHDRDLEVRTQQSKFCSQEEETRILIRKLSVPNLWANVQSLQPSSYLVKNQTMGGNRMCRYLSSQNRLIKMF